MIVKLRAGMMPPPGGRRPPADSLLQLVETLESVIDRAAALEPNPGARRFQHLTRAEYQRVVRDLLGLEIDASRWLPADTYLGNFDNLSAAQGLSTTLLESNGNDVYVASGAGPTDPLIQAIDLFVFRKPG